MAAARVRAWVPYAVFLASFVYLFVGMFQPLDPFDEGLVVLGAERILHGALPYRDFAAYYFPGQFYTLAAIFHVFGSSVLVERIWDTLVRVGICGLVFLIARGLVPGRLAYFPFFIMVFFLGWYGFYGYPAIPAMFCALMAIFLLVQNRPGNGAWQLLLAGFAAGLSIFYRQDVGFYIAAAGCLALLIAGMPRPEGNTSRRSTAIERLKPSIWFGLGTCLVLVPLLAYFVGRIPPSQLWADFMKLPRLQVHFRYQRLPPIIPSPSFFLSSMTLNEAWFMFYLPVAIFAITALKLARAMFGPTAGPQARKPMFTKVLLTLFGSLLLITTVTRADVSHCLAPMIPSAILAVPLLREWPSRQTRGELSLAACFVAIAVCAVPFAAVPMIRWGLNLQRYPPWGRTSGISRARFFSVPPDQEAAVRFIQAHVPANQAIFVANTEHQRAFGNDALFYFLANRRPGTKYEEFEPGVVTTAKVQRQIVHELRENRVDWVVQFSGFEPAARRMYGPGAGATVLDSFLRSNYKIVDRLGWYSIFEKVAEREPSASSPLDHGAAKPKRPPV